MRLSVMPRVSLIKISLAQGMMSIAGDHFVTEVHLPLTTKTKARISFRHEAMLGGMLQPCDLRC